MDTIVTSGAAWILIVGFGIGLKHALDADHLAAIGTMVTEKRSPLGMALLGGTWGLGHTLALLAVGLVVLFLDLEISGVTEKILEGLVGIMLIGLGLNVIRRLLKGGKLHSHSHSHLDKSHSHPHIHLDDESISTRWHHGERVSPKALVIGLVHGLAGSAGLMLLIIPTIDSKTLGILYIVIFGIGSIGGMMIVSFLIGLPFHLTSKNLEPLNKGLQTVAGLVSTFIGGSIVFEMLIS